MISGIVTCRSPAFERMKYDFSSITTLMTAEALVASDALSGSVVFGASGALVGRLSESELPVSEGALPVPVVESPIPTPTVLPPPKPFQKSGRYIPTMAPATSAATRTFRFRNNQPRDLSSIVDRPFCVLDRLYFVHLDHRHEFIDQTRRRGDSRGQRTRTGRLRYCRLASVRPRREVL